MKKRNFKSLNLNRKTISKFLINNISGGGLKTEHCSNYCSHKVFECPESRSPYACPSR